MSRKQRKPASPEMPKTTRAPELIDIDAFMNSPETIAWLAKQEEKDLKAEARRAAKQAKRDKENEERRRNPQSAIDAYWNHMEKCPSFGQRQERSEWKRENPTFEFNGITYSAHWFSQRSNSGKTSEWYGCLKGSDGNLIWIKEPPRIPPAKAALPEMMWR